MIGNKGRIAFINEYISAYEEKIKLANANHLFDEAQLFELFAQEICKLWYGQSFTNLNLIQYNYPCVDLISEDEEIYVQVSTQKNIMGKIKDTLKSLDNTDDPRLVNVTTPVFFVLSNESECNVTDLVDENQVGRFAFTVAENLISTQMVVKKACNDLKFQTGVYELLKRDVESLSELSERLLNEFDYSINVGLNNIITCIKGEYELDRSDLVNRIKSESHQFSFVGGDAGSGKSVICKKILEDEQKILFRRADKLLGCNSINDIWGMDISSALKSLRGSKVFIYIDALEYISYSNESTKELLQTLLYEISKYPYASFLASCRSCDVGAFIKIISRFSIKQFVVDPISPSELKQLSDKYKVIHDMSLSGKYAELLRFPFYINEIVSREIDLAELSDVNSFRDYIWKNSICLTEKAIENNIPTNDLIKVVEHLVVERSKRLTPGIIDDEIDLRILRLLRSNNVITDNEKYVRLKYDIYEDICFEKILDREFDSCRGDYRSFFANVKEMGEGIYRRYQIWISNKLLAKENRDKFLYALIFDNNTHEWHQNTIIGVLKSPYCKGFFDEYGIDIIEHGLLPDLLDLTNSFCFEMRGILYNDTKSICWLNLVACGFGRVALIHLLYTQGLYTRETVVPGKIIKLCSDYALRMDSHDDLTDEYVCTIVCDYLDKFLNEQKLKEHNTIEIIQSLLSIIYKIPAKATRWIISFWNKLETDICSDDCAKVRTAQRLLDWTLDHITAELINVFIDELLSLAEKVWMTENIIAAKKHTMYGYNNDDLWGINGSGSDYHSSHHNVSNDIFLRAIFVREFKRAFEWSLILINKMVSEYARQCPDKVTEITLFDSVNNLELTVLGSPEMWYAGREEHMIPTIIGDLIYWLKNTIIQSLESCINNLTIFHRLTDSIKATISKISNSIIPFTIIEEIGFKYFNIIPGYAGMLASDINLISWDIQWCAHNMTSPEKTILMNQMLMAFGLPDLPKRYPQEKYDINNIQDYLVRSQLFTDEITQSHCEKTIDFLYEKIDKNDPRVLLQVQKMDMRNADYYVDKNMITISAALSEGPQRIVDENKLDNQLVVDVLNMLNSVLANNDEDNLEIILNCIESFRTIMNTKEMIIKYENFYITLICLAFTKPTITKDKRSELIDDWVERLQGFISRRNSYIVDFKLTYFLFCQIKQDFDDKVKDKLKLLMLSCLIADPADGQIAQIREILIKYLLTDNRTSRYIFNSIIKIAEDEWNHTNYNLKRLKKSKRRSYTIRGGHGVPLQDDIIRALGIKPYTSRRDYIIKSYLYEEKTIDLTSVNIDQLDLGYLFIAMNVGMRLSDVDFYTFAKRVMPCFISSMSLEKESSIMDNYYQRLAMKRMLEREITDEDSNYKVAIDLLFDDIDYSDFSHDVIDMYVSIFSGVDSCYFDSHNNADRRKKCQDIILYAEDKIQRIDNQYVRAGLEKILVLDSDSMVDWNKCETHYSYQDKVFLCEMWGKYYRNHEVEVLRVIYQMKIDELLPDILPVVSSLVESLVLSNDTYEEESEVILRTIVLKSLVSYAYEIKADINYHASYEKILNAMISRNDETAAVILDEYRMH